MSKWVVYLLCFDGPDPFPKHYVGVTQTSRLAKRMMEHRAGKGGVATQQARREQRGWSLARTWPTDDITLERRLAAYDGIASVCPICAHLAQGQHQQPYPLGNPEVFNRFYARFPTQ